MRLLDIAFWIENQRALGVFAIAIGVGAWIVELADLAYVCPYCRVQRTVIALLGIAMLFPQQRHWVIRYIMFTIGSLGAVVAINQNFRGWASISSGEFSLGEQWYLNPFLLSGAALFLIVAQVWLIAFSDTTQGLNPGHHRAEDTGRLTDRRIADRLQQDDDKSDG